jgi:GT2 family glycosyltransferase
VDDGSTDGTAEAISDQFKEGQLLRGDGTLWWTGSINLGIGHAMWQASADDAVLVINDDLEVDPDYLAAIHWVSRSARTSLIGSVGVDIRVRRSR